MRPFVCALVLMSLGACAGGLNEDAAKARDICAIAYGDPALDPVRGRIPFEDDAAAKAAMDTLSDPGRPTAAEREALIRLDAANRRCWDAWDKAGTSPVIQSARAKVSGALGALYSGNSTYGEFNRTRATAISEMRAEIERQRYANYPSGYGGGPGVTLGLGVGFFRF